MKLDGMTSEEITVAMKEFFEKIPLEMILEEFQKPGVWKDIVYESGIVHPFPQSDMRKPGE